KCGIADYFTGPGIDEEIGCQEAQYDFEPAFAEPLHERDQEQRDEPRFNDVPNEQLKGRAREKNMQCVVTSQPERKINEPFAKGANDRSASAGDVGAQRARVDQSKDYHGKSDPKRDIE